VNALYLTLFVSFVLAALGVVLFLHSASQKDSQHTDRLALLPLADDDAPAPDSDPKEQPPAAPSNRLAPSEPNDSNETDPTDDISEGDPR